ncbi:FeoA family protein [Candidatus Bandiella euplotis]|uniref:Ferrous iron transport protein A n=1 Tax=Candidatus Bandiella euplotis TaxID=1664265 RepID=A0ABZ0UR39_9RICK|nr:FeoA family protein [Candidatus Bandiella woodruffii]WPX97183.1 Ferrous iron transport protein A [Candidatus Bandiella woodruffii]
MGKISLTMLSKGANFVIQSFSLDNIQKLKLMELGFLPKIKMQLLHKNRFGSVIVRTNGTKYAIDNSIAQNLLITRSI